MRLASKTSPAVLLTLALVGGFAVGCKSKSESAPGGKSQPVSLPPGRTVADGQLGITLWNQQKVPGRQGVVTSFRIQHVVDGNASEPGATERLFAPRRKGEPTTLKALSLRLVRTDGTEKTHHLDNLTVDPDKPTCAIVSSEVELSRAEVQAEHATGNNPKPIVYDFVAAKQGTQAPPSTTEEFVLDKASGKYLPSQPAPCYVSTSLGCLNSIVKVDVGRLSGRGTMPAKSFIVLSFDGRGLLEFSRDDFTIRDAESNAAYLWTFWEPGGDLMYFPGSSMGAGGRLRLGLD